jgi:hypothetical protein
MLKTGRGVQREVCVRAPSQPFFIQGLKGSLTKQRKKDMERVWEEESPHANFFRRLLNSRVDELVNSPTWLKRMRYNNEEVKWWQKNCGHIFEERGLNLYQLIATSHGECWDTEDEQKCAQALEENVVPPLLKEKPRQEDAVSLDYAREISVRCEEEEEPELPVRTSDERRKGVLQEGLGREELYRRGGGTGRTQEAPAKKKKPSEEVVRRGRVKKQHTAGLGNIEEGRLADKLKPAKKRQRKRPVLGGAFKNMN